MGLAEAEIGQDHEFNGLEFMLPHRVGHYMWENFARHEKCMKYFVAHKDAIVPKIKERIAHDDVSEVEKRILYGFLLDEDEVWKI